MSIFSILSLSVLFGLVHATPTENNQGFLQSPEALVSLVAATSEASAEPLWQEFEAAPEAQQDPLAELLDAAFQDASDGAISNDEQLALDHSLSDWVTTNQAASEQYSVVVEDLMEAAMEGALNNLNA